MTFRLADGIRDMGLDCEVSPVAVAGFDVTHSMVFHFADVQPRSLSTVFVTHLDDQLKVDRVKASFRGGMDGAICMSSMTVQQLERSGIDPRKLTWVPPAHDQAIQPRRIVIGLTTNLYPDGRKREWMLDRLAADMDLSAFEFRIFGRGWEGKVEGLRSSGATVSIHPGAGDIDADYEQLRGQTPTFDYYLYLGLDEGSLGTLDALAAGVPTIVTTQGFHVDLPNAITFGFWDYEELLTIFRRIADDRNARIAAVAPLTWRSYAENHVGIWNSLKTRGVATRPEQTGPGAAKRKTASLTYFGMMFSKDHRKKLVIAVKARIKRLLFR
jgi:hypothetical protein